MSVNNNLPPSRWGAPYYLKWCFTVKDFAEAFSISEAQVRQAIRDGKLDPTAVHGLADFAALRTKRREGKFQFTYEDLARATGRSLSTVRSTLRIRRNEVRDVAAFVQRSFSDRSVKFTVQEIFGDNPDEIARWEKRWPRFDLYRCGVPECDSIVPLLEPGLCVEHGGSPDPLITIQDSHVVVRLGNGYVPICHLMLGAATSNLKVRHLDDNHWNNRPDNLEIVDGVVRSRRARWSYGYRELAKTCDLSEDSIRQAVSRKVFDPQSLSSVVNFWYLQHPKDT